MDALDRLLSEVVLPADPAEWPAWREERAARVGRVLADAFAAAIEEACTAYAASLTAAGDPYPFDVGGAAVREFATEVVGEYAAGMHLSGALSVYLTAPGVDSIPAEAAAAWSSVVNDSAVVFQRTATNRIVGATDALWNDVRSLSVDAIQVGMPNEDLKGVIEEATGYSEHRADTIARTETVGAYNGGEMAGARALGANGPVEKVWSAALDARTRPDHEAADGQWVRLDEAFDVGGEPMDHPVDPSASAANSVNCRCSMLLLYAGDERPDGTIAGDYGDEPVVVEPTPEEARAAAQEEKAAAREADVQSAAKEFGVHPDEVRVAMSEVSEVKALARADAALVQRESYGVLDAADALKVARPPRGLVDAGGEWDWLRQVDDAERRRLRAAWYIDSPSMSPDNLADRFRTLFPDAVGLGDDEVMERYWLFHSRRIEATGALRRGKLPSMRNYSDAFDLNDLVPGLRAQGYDVNVVLGGSDAQVAAHIAAVKRVQVVEEAYQALGPAAAPVHGPAVYRMGFQAFEEEVLSLDYVRANRAWTAVERARYDELVPYYLDAPGSSLEDVYAATVSAARLAELEVADYAVIPWA